MDVVFPVRPGDENEELRCSLRSIAAHLPHGRVWLAGHRPAWCSAEVGHIPVAQAGSKWANSRANRLAACRDADVSEAFVLMNDDFFVMQPVDELPVLHRGPVTQVLRGYHPGARTPYVAGMRATADWLRRRGVEEPISYELHAPMAVTKTGLAEVLALAEASGIEAPHVRTMFGNLHAVGGEQAADVKVHALDETPDDDAVFVSTTDASFARGQVGGWIRERLAQPCRYER